MNEVQDIIPIDGSDADKINIGNLDNYTVVSEDEDEEAIAVKMMTHLVIKHAPFILTPHATCSFRVCIYYSLC